MAKIQILKDEYETKVVDLFTASRALKILQDFQSGQSDIFMTYEDLLHLYFNFKDVEKIASKYPIEMIQNIITAIIEHPYDDIKFEPSYHNFKDLNNFYKDIERE